MPTPVIAVVNVKTPWYAFHFLLRRGFRKAVPEYQQVPGLRFKYFATSADHRFFGGIYLWASQADAQRWFSPQWFERVRRTYKAEGNVRFFDVLNEYTAVPPDFDFKKTEGKSRVVFCDGTANASTSPAGLLRRYEVQKGQAMALVLLFKDEGSATAFLAAHPAAGAEVYKTPVLLNNE